jgi:hypothetical protein
MATARSLRLAGERRAQAMVGLVCSVVVLFIGLVTYLMLGGA